jgi:hypothetical protein
VGVVSSTSRAGVGRPCLGVMEIGKTIISRRGKGYTGIDLGTVFGCRFLMKFRCGHRYTLKGIYQKGQKPWTLAI